MKKLWSTGLGAKTSVISGCGMLIRGVVKFSARNCPGINFKKVGNYVADNFHGVQIPNVGDSFQVAVFSIIIDHS